MSHVTAPKDAAQDPDAYFTLPLCTAPTRLCRVLPSIWQTGSLDSSEGDVPVAEIAQSLAW